MRPSPRGGLQRLPTCRHFPNARLPGSAPPLGRARALFRRGDSYVRSPPLSLTRCACVSASSHARSFPRVASFTDALVHARRSFSRARVSLGPRTLLLAALPLPHARVTCMPAPFFPSPRSAVLSATCGSLPRASPRVSLAPARLARARDTFLPCARTSRAPRLLLSHYSSRPPYAAQPLCFCMRASSPKRTAILHMKNPSHAQNARAHSFLSFQGSVRTPFHARVARSASYAPALLAVITLSPARAHHPQCRPLPLPRALLLCLHSKCSSQPSMGKVSLVRLHGFIQLSCLHSSPSTTCRMVLASRTRRLGP